MKKVVFLFFAIFMVSMIAQAQFAAKAGISLKRNEITNYVVTGQFHKELLVLSGDLYVPMQKHKKLAGGGRIGLGFGGYRLRIAGDVGATYETKNWRCGCGVEANLRLYGPIGIFGRWSRNFPIVNKRCERKEILWGHGRSEISVGVVIDLSNGSCY